MITRKLLNVPLLSALLHFLLFVIISVPAVLSDGEFKCPKNQFYLFPCRCLSGGFKGISLLCDNSNLATFALALGNVKEPISSLVISNSNITRLIGPLFKEKSVLSLTFQNSNLHDVDSDSLACLKNDIRSLSFEGNHFRSIPESINVLLNLTRVVFANTASISEVKSGAFKKLVNLIEVDLHNNSIKKIESATFAPLVVLERLDLSHNLLSKLERNLFRTNKKLSYLDLSHNKFKEIGKADFNDLLAVQTLNLSFNELKELPRSIFSRVSQLKVLNLSGNKFTQIDAYLLRGIRFLKELHASHNLIKELSRNSFQTTTRIKLIDLSYNELTEVEPEIFKDMQWLDLIDISYNKLNKIKKSSFQRMFKIGINLSHNNISTIEFKAFQELQNITELDLSHNQLATLKANIFDECDCTVFNLNHNLITNLSNFDIFANLTGMRMLNLSHNLITELNRKHFTTKKLFELNLIDLSYNNISAISGNVFEKFVSIRTINLSHNVITKLGHAAFGTVATLLDLDISHNKIKEISNGGVSSLISVKTIYANDNQLEKMFPISVAVNTIHLENNQISNIQSNAFPVINAILEIYLDNNNISKLDGDAFKTCLSLNTLSLARNQLTQVPQAALSPLMSLQNLDLSWNRLTKLDRQAFGSLRILFDLNLSHNFIANISENAFEGLLQLLVLNMSHNQIEHVLPDVFNTMVSLHTLDLSYNGISSLDNNTHSIFEPLLSLDRLNMSHNKISLIKNRSFPHSPWIPYKLRQLDLSYNTIPLLTSHFDNGLGKVEWLSLRGNILNEIFADTLGNLTQLKYLDLSHNDLRKLPKGVFRPSMKRLEHLDLSANKIISFTVSELNEMTALQWLDLSANKFTHIDDSLFGKIKKGLLFHFNDNHLYCDCKLMPLVSWIYSEKHKAQLEGQQSPVFDHWSGLSCNDPKPVNGKALVDLRADMLNCDKAEMAKFRKYFLSSRPIKIRAIEKFRKRRQDSIKVVWFVQNRIKDIASFNVLLRREREDNSYIVNETVAYLKRDYLFTSLPIHQKFVVCIFPIDSTGVVFSDFHNDCLTFNNGQVSIDMIDADLIAEESASSSSAPFSVNSRKPTLSSSATSSKQTVKDLCNILLLVFLAKYLFVN